MATANESQPVRQQIQPPGQDQYSDSPPALPLNGFITDMP